MQIIPDPAFGALMTLPFVVTLIALNFLFFAPFREYLDGRHEATEGARAEAARLSEQAEQKLADLEARLAAGREAAAAIRAEQRQVALAAEAAKVGEARGAAEAQLAESLKAIEAEAATARAAIKDTAQSISADIAAQVLGRSVEA